MNVASAGEVFTARAEGDRSGGLVDQVACVGTNNVNSENGIGFGVGEDFDGAVHLAEGSRAGIRAEWKSAPSKFCAEIFQFVLRFAN